MNARVIAGRYRLVEELGRGGSGVVWRAEDELLHRPVAVKLINLRNIPEADRATTARMLREARLAARLKNPHAVAIYDADVSDAQPYIVMELVPGTSLAAMLKQRTRIDADTVATSIAQAASALAAAHELGIVHRDVKPGNIMITDSGNAKLADFGIARTADDTSITATGDFIGTLAFMAPEVARGEPASPASDIWSLGATFFAAVEGHSPFLAANEPATPDALMRVLSEVPPQPTSAGRHADLITAMLNPNPTARPTARQVVAAAQPGTPADPAVPDASGQPAAPRAHRVRRMSRRTTLVAVAVAVLAGGTATAIALTAGGGPAHHQPSAGSPTKPATTAPRSPDHSTASASPAAVAKLIDLASAPVTLNTGNNPVAARVTPDGKHLWVIADGGSQASGHPDGEADVFALPSFVFERRIPLGPRPEDVVFSADGSTGYLPEIGPDSGVNGHLDVVTVSTGHVSRITVGPYPTSVALSADGTRAFVGNGNLDHNSLFVVNLATQATTVFANLSQAQQILPSADGKTLFVTSNEGLTAVSTSSGKVLWRNASAAGALVRCGAYICQGSPPNISAGASSVAMSVLDPADGRVIAAVTLGTSSDGTGQVNGMASTPDGHDVYAAYMTSSAQAHPDEIAILSFDGNRLSVVNQRRITAMDGVNAMTYVSDHLLVLHGFPGRTALAYG